MIRSHQEQLTHDEMVRAMASHFINQGYVIQADLSGFTSPPIVNGHRPDLVLYYLGKRRIIVEVETESTYKLSHTYSQFKAFSSSTAVDFHAVVPKNVLNAAQRVANNWGVYPSKWWYI